MITMAHGAGGRAMRELIESEFVPVFDDPSLAALDDQARLGLEHVRTGDRLALTTDSYVVTPLFFPGGDIGKLAVCGTVNDLVVGGAVPRYLTCSFIIEEGLPLATLRRVVHSMSDAALAANVRIVTGDTKVVERGAADQLYVNTAGVGFVPAGRDLAPRNVRPGDAVIVNGEIGDHGAAILAARGELHLEHAVASDCTSLHRIVTAMLEVCPEIRWMRDATRGGVAAVLGELASAADVAIHLHEAAIPLRTEVRGVCELLGLDPLYMANEGKLVAVVPGAAAERVVAAIRRYPEASAAAVVGEVVEQPRGSVVMHTSFGGQRFVDVLDGAQLPRIC